MNDDELDKSRECKTNPQGLEPPAKHILGAEDQWERIDGAPDWLNEKDRRDHANARMLLNEVRLLAERVQTIEGRVHHHDQRITQLETENRQLRRENAKLRVELDQHIDKTRDDDDR